MKQNRLVSVTTAIAAALVLGIAFQTQSASAQMPGSGFHQGDHNHGHPGNPGPGFPSPPNDPYNPGYPNYPNYPGYGQLSYQQAEQVALDFYRAFLFRNADASGLQGMISSIMNQGQSAAVAQAVGVIQSQEFYQNVRGRYSDQQILANIYRVFFHRNVDQSGFYNWLPMMQQGRYADVASGIVGSDEFRNNYLYH